MCKYQSQQHIGLMSGLLVTTLIYIYPFNIWASVASPIDTGILKDFVCEMCILT